MPLPLVLGGLARLGAGPILRRLAGRALRFATKGRLIGAGGGAAIARRVGGAAVGAATAAEIVRQVRRPGEHPRGKGNEPTRSREQYEDDIGYRRYRRMNPMNVRALRRSVRRINSAEKLFRKVFTITKGQVNVRKARRSA